MKDRSETANQILKFVRQSFERRATEQDMLNGIEFHLRKREQFVLLEALEPANRLLQSRMKELKEFREQVIFDNGSMLDMN